MEMLNQELPVTRKHKASPLLKPRPAQNRVDVSTDPETQTTAMGQTSQGPAHKRPKRSYAFYKPLSSSSISNVRHSKFLCFSLSHPSQWQRW